MVKLVRNVLGDWKVLVDDNHHEIKWEYLEKLVSHQETHGLHTATKFRRRHLNYKGEIMKVQLAVQTVSASVSDALQYFEHDLKLESFANADAIA